MCDSHVEIFAFGMYYTVVSSASSRPAQTNVHPLFYSRANLLQSPLPDANAKKESKCLSTKAHKRSLQKFRFYVTLRNRVQVTRFMRNEITAHNIIFQLKELHSTIKMSMK